MIDKNHEKHLERLCKLARDISSSKKKSKEFFKLVGIHDQDGHLTEPYKMNDKLKKGGNTIIDTKEFLKLKEEHMEMLELLEKIHDNGLSEHDNDLIKIILIKASTNEKLIK